MIVTRHLDSVLHKLKSQLEQLDVSIQVHDVPSTHGDTLMTHGIVFVCKRTYLHDMVHE
jgi:hypothetical protein